MKEKKTDLRIIRTKKAIRDAFCEMIMEMDYQEITVKELTSRAMINRNTFYLHYESIDALMEELQNEISDRFISKQISYSNIVDIKNLIRMFFESISERSDLENRLLCSGSYQFAYEKINKQIMEHRKETNRGAFGLDEYSENIIFTYFGSITPILYRQWVSDGRKLPLEDVIELATKLICNGLESVIQKDLSL